MLTRITFAQAAGKAVAAAYADYRVVVVRFTDDTYAAVRATRDRDDGEPELMEDFDLLKYYGEDLCVRVGVITAAERAALWREREAAHQARTAALAAEERALYERLRTKYEGKA